MPRRRVSSVAKGIVAVWTLEARALKLVMG